MPYYSYSLRNLIEHHQYGLNVKYALEIVLQICKGISYLHSLASIHGDIKPQNIMFVKNENLEYHYPILIDFGNSFGHLFKQGPHQIPKATQTLIYRSPQTFNVPQLTNQLQKNSIEYCQARDIWSIGLVAYQCLTGSYLVGTAQTQDEDKIQHVFQEVMVQIEKNLKGKNQEESDRNPWKQIIERQLKKWFLSTSKIQFEICFELLTKCLQIFPSKRIKISNLQQLLQNSLKKLSQ